MRDEVLSEGRAKGKTGVQGSSRSRRRHKRRSAGSSNYHGGTNAMSGGEPLSPTSVDKPTTSDTLGRNTTLKPHTSSSQDVAQHLQATVRTPQRPPAPSRRSPIGDSQFPPSRGADENAQNSTTQADSISGWRDAKEVGFFREDASTSGEAPSAGGPAIPRPPARWLVALAEREGTRRRSADDVEEAGGAPVMAAPSAKITLKSARPVLSPLDEGGVGNSDNWQLIYGGDMCDCQSESNVMMGSGALAVSAHDCSKEEEICRAVERCSLHLDVCKEIERMSYADFEKMRNSIDRIAYFFSSCFPDEQRNILIETLSKSLEDQTFSAKAGAFYGAIQSITIEEVTVRKFLFDALSNNRSDWMQGKSVTQLRNSVFLLSEFFYQMTNENNGTNVLGETLIQFLKILLTEDEKDVETLTTCLVVNGTRLMQEHAHRFPELMNLVKRALENGLTSRRNRNFLLYIIDMHHAEFRYLYEEREKLFKQLLGEHTFFGFRRMVPSLAPFFMQESNPIYFTQSMVEPNQQLSCEPTGTVTRQQWHTGE